MFLVTVDNKVHIVKHRRYYMMTTFMRVIQSKFTKNQTPKKSEGRTGPRSAFGTCVILHRQTDIIMTLSLLIKVGLLYSFSIFRNLLMTTEPALNLCLVAYTFEITPRNTMNASLIRTEITLKMHNGL